MPIYISDFVIGSFGTGCVVGVPGIFAILNLLSQKGIESFASLIKTVTPRQSRNRDKYKKKAALYQ